jgi:hypothetical protein
MPGLFYRGKDVKIWISTEDPTYGIVKSGGGDIVVTTSASATTVAVLPAGSHTFSTELTNVVGLTFDPTKEKETIEYLGRNLDDYIHVRDMAEIQITKLQDSHAFAALGRYADGGVDGAALNEVDEIKRATHGYRIFIQVKGSELIYTFRNACVVSHQSMVGANKTNNDVLIFRSPLWENASTAYLTATTNGEL